MQSRRPSSSATENPGTFSFKDVMSPIQHEQRFPPIVKGHLGRERWRSLDLWATYNDHGIQGRFWHVEGKMDDDICASAICYYHSLNITPSHLAFWQQPDTDTMHVDYQQDHRDWLLAVFGCQLDEPSIQERHWTWTFNSINLRWDCRMNIDDGSPMCICYSHPTDHQLASFVPPSPEARHTSITVADNPDLVSLTKPIPKSEADVDYLAGDGSTCESECS
ncbi:hypothetical protein D9615_007585 [Tricholomella constricta]|uniref:DUF4246 domain-containing protein n=1 Tax=Tricholomella constricta TaxID=117010 RepID=A0A8H5M2E2_9AGAR|nr:hypothetical protein D9615_007585 [Tricholomella constricta]